MERTPLFYAIMDGDIVQATELINSGEEVNAHDVEGKTLLHLAAIHFQPAAVELLLKNNAEVDSVDSNGNTPLFDAIFNSQGKGEIIGLLLRAGADRTRKNLHGVSPMELANSITNYNITQFLGD